MSANWSCSDATLVLTSDVQMEDHERWLAERRSGIGGSDMAALMGEGRYDNQTEFDVWLSKTGRVGDVEVSEAMLWGNLLEDTVARRFADKAGLTIQRRGLMRSKRAATVQVNVDRLTDDGGIYEGKIANAFIKLPTDLEHRGGWPGHWYWQGVAGMAVTGRSHAWLGALMGGNRLEVRRIEREDCLEDIEKVFEVAPSWYLRHVVGDEPPEVGAPPDLEEIDPGKKREAAIPGLVWDQRLRLRELRRLAKAAKEEADEIREALKAEAGRAEFLTANGIPVVKVGFVQGRLSLKKDRFNAAHPDINLDDFYERGAGHRAVYLIGDDEE